MRILCLDVGTKRIGVASTDPMCLFAQPQKVIARRGGVADMKEIGKICRELGAGKIIVGLPLDEDGGEGAAAGRVRAFAGRLGEYLAEIGLNPPMEFWDERYSTATAEERLIGADVGRKKRRRVIDKMAALAILEDYLDKSA